MLVELRRMLGDRRQVTSLIAETKHAYRQWWKQIGVGESIGKAPSGADLVVHTLQGGDVVRFAHHIPQDAQGGRQCNAVCHQKAERSDDARCPPITYRATDTRNAG